MTRTSTDGSGLRRDGMVREMNTLEDLEYYLGYRPNSDAVEEAENWMLANPGSSLSEWVHEMVAIGAL